MFAICKKHTLQFTLGWPGKADYQKFVLQAAGLTGSPQGPIPDWVLKHPSYQDLVKKKIIREVPDFVTEQDEEEPDAAA